VSEVFLVSVGYPDTSFVGASDIGHLSI